MTDQASLCSIRLARQSADGAVLDPCLGTSVPLVKGQTPNYSVDRLGDPPESCLHELLPNKLILKVYFDDDLLFPRPRWHFGYSRVLAVPFRACPAVAEYVESMSNH